MSVAESAVAMQAFMIGGDKQQLFPSNQHSFMALMRSSFLSAGFAALLTFLSVAPLQAAEATSVIDTNSPVAQALLKAGGLFKE